MTTAATAEQAAPSGLIVEDNAAQIDAAQMRKTQFLDRLQSEVCAAADAELARVGQTAQGCPYIENWIGYYRSRPASHVERALKRYAPEASAATSAADYIPLVAERVRRAVTVWATTGEITGVPEELAGQLPTGGLLGAMGGILSGIGGAVTGALGSVGSAIGGIFTKTREGEAAGEGDAEQIQSQLSGGQSLDAGVKSKMEGAYGHDFSHVRVHTDSRAAGLSDGLNARAFTIGNDIAFAAGEYKPGTLIGDALLAHELAHVVQQGSQASFNAPMQKGQNEYNSLEEDADVSAVNAVVSMWGKTKGAFGNISQNAMPRFRSGLKLQRCPASKQAGPPTTTPTTTPGQSCKPTLQNPEWSVSPEPRLVPVQGGCALDFSGGRPPAEAASFGGAGMSFKGNIQIPPTCPGKVYFTQLVNQVNLSIVACEDGTTVCQGGSLTWGFDKFKHIPSRYASDIETRSGQTLEQLVNFGDSPGHPNISEIDTMVRFCLEDEFVTFIVHENPAGVIQPLGWMHWKFNARAWRDAGTCPATTRTPDCAGWHLDGVGQKLGDNFAGGAPPVPLNFSLPVVTAADLPFSDCPENTCAAPAAGSTQPIGGPGK
ncbi:MAG: DUF4157 domain-containing protein [Blastocatellia bacterium]